MKPDSTHPAPGSEPSSWTAGAAARVEPELVPALLARALLLEVYGHARECYPEECCGLIAGPPDSAPSRVIRCHNVQNQRRSQGESELGAGRAFWIDERELLDALRAIESSGEVLKLIYHSHIDAPAYLSHTDVRAALGPEGTPLYPRVAQLVISVSENGVQASAVFDWDPSARRFVGRPLREGG